MNIIQTTAARASAAFSFLKSKTTFAGRIALIILVMQGVARAESPDDKYLGIFNLMAQADSLMANGEINLARTKYVQAQSELTMLKRDNPLWNAKIVAYRLNYLAEKVAATSSKSDASNTGLTRTAAPGERPQKMAGTSAAPSVALTLLGSGSEPRKVLRLHPAAGDKETLSMTMKIAMNMTMGDTPAPPIKLPPSQMSMEFTVQNVAANGDITYEMLMGDASVSDDPEVMPQIADAMKASMSKLRGMSGKSTVSSRGFNLSTDLKMPADADAQARQTLAQIKESIASSSAPLPEEAVGVGARWEVKSKLKSQGMTIDQNVTYELVSIDDDQLNLKSTITQSALNQKIENPAMPGLKVDLTKMTGNGTGGTSWNLTKLLPSESTMDEQMDMAMGINLGGTKQTMNMKMDMNIHMQSN